MLERLAPPPDFRYVGLRGYEPPKARALAALAIGASLTTSAQVFGASWMMTGLAAGAGMLATSVLYSRFKRDAHWLVRSARPVNMAIVPWGVLLTDEAPRTLRWGSIRNIQFDVIHGREDGVPTTLYSVVLVQTEREELSGMAPGAAGLERLVAYLAAYQSEQSFPIAVDFHGTQASDASEPFAESLLGASSTYLLHNDASDSLGLHRLSYRDGIAKQASDEAIGVLREILSSQTPQTPDRRAFAAALAGELAATELAEDLVRLVQCPNPRIAAMAKAAAVRLGVASSRVGTMDELLPFLDERDCDLLATWALQRHSPTNQRGT